jgi:5-methylthioadenosine/S-adenosylhomocysteine deaminase
MDWFTADKIFHEGAYRSALFLGVENGSVARVVDKAPASAAVTAFPGCAIFPGTVNTHTHSFHSLLRGQGDDLPLMAWLNDVVYRHAATITVEQAYWGAALAYAEMLKNGITTVVDFFYLNGRGNDYAIATIRAAEDVGIRLTFSRTFMDWELAPDTIRENVLQARGRYEELSRAYRSHPTVRICPSAHSLYAASTDMIMAARECAVHGGTQWHMHVADSAGSEKRVRSACGCSTIARMDQLAVLDESLVAVHAVYVDDEEADLLARKRVKISHNPAANMFLGDKACPVRRLRRQGAVLGLGTDSALDNNSLSIFHEMKLAALTQKSQAGDPEAIKAADLIEMATVNGGILAEWPVGKLTPDHAADFVVIDRTDLALVPDDRLASHMVYSMSDRAIRHVYVNGRCVVRNGRLAGIDEQELVANVRKVAGPFFSDS